MPESKLFQVEILYKNAELSSLLTYGGMTSGVHKKNNFVVALSPEDAVNKTYDFMEQKVQKVMQKNSDTSKGEALGTLNREDALPSYQCPSWPVDKEKWVVKEVKVPGFKIVVFEEKQGDFQEPQKTEITFWSKIWRRFI